MELFFSSDCRTFSKKSIQKLYLKLRITKIDNMIYSLLRANLYAQTSSDPFRDFSKKESSTKHKISLVPNINESGVNRFRMTTFQWWSVL